MLQTLFASSQFFQRKTEHVVIEFTASTMEKPGESLVRDGFARKFKLTADCFRTPFLTSKMKPTPVA